jgi:hypothetical protein
MDDPLFLQLTAIIDPYSILLIWKIFSLILHRFFAAYFDRYTNIKIFQGQAAGDQFFLLDNEVKVSNWKSICKYLIFV